MVLDSFSSLLFEVDKIGIRVIKDSLLFSHFPERANLINPENARQT